MTKKKKKGPKEVDVPIKGHNPDLSGIPGTGDSMADRFFRMLDEYHPNSGKTKKRFPKLL